MPLKDVARFVSDLMREIGADYVVIGGVAVSAVGEPRSTKDVDLVVLLPTSKAGELVALIEEKGRPVSRRPSVLSKLRAGKPAKILWDKKYSFDIRFASFTIDGNALLRARTVNLPAYGTTLKVATPEDLIVYKLARFEDIDRGDIRKLIALNALNWKYIAEQTRILADEAEKPEMLERLVTIKEKN